MIGAGSTDEPLSLTVAGRKEQNTQQVTHETTTENPVTTTSQVPPDVSFSAALRNYSDNQNKGSYCTGSADGGNRKRPLSAMTIRHRRKEMSRRTSDSALQVKSLTPTPAVPALVEQTLQRFETIEQEKHQTKEIIAEVKKIWRTEGVLTQEAGEPETETSAETGTPRQNEEGAVDKFQNIPQEEEAENREATTATSKSAKDVSISYHNKVVSLRDTIGALKERIFPKGTSPVKSPRTESCSSQEGSSSSETGSSSSETGNSSSETGNSSPRKGSSSPHPESNSSRRSSSPQRDTTVHQVEDLPVPPGDSSTDGATIEAEKKRAEPCPEDSSSQSQSPELRETPQCQETGSPEEGKQTTPDPRDLGKLESPGHSGTPSPKRTKSTEVRSKDGSPENSPRPSSSIIQGLSRKPSGSGSAKTTKSKGARSAKKYVMDLKVYSAPATVVPVPTKQGPLPVNDFQAAFIKSISQCKDRDAEFVSSISRPRKRTYRDKNDDETTPEKSNKMEGDDGTRCVSEEKGAATTTVLADELIVDDEVVRVELADDDRSQSTTEQQHSSHGEEEEDHVVDSHSDTTATPVDEDIERLLDSELLADEPNETGHGTGRDEPAPQAESESSTSATTGAGELEQNTEQEGGQRVDPDEEEEEGVEIETEMKAVEGEPASREHDQPESLEAEVQPAPQSPVAPNLPAAKDSKEFADAAIDILLEAQKVSGIVPENYEGSTNDTGESEVPENGNGATGTEVEQTVQLFGETRPEVAADIMTSSTPDESAPQTQNSDAVTYNTSAAQLPAPASSNNTPQELQQPTTTETTIEGSAAEALNAIEEQLENSQAVAKETDDVTITHVTEPDLTITGVSEPEGGPGWQNKNRARQAPVIRPLTKQSVLEQYKETVYRKDPTGILTSSERVQKEVEQIIKTKRPRVEETGSGSYDTDTTHAHNTQHNQLSQQLTQQHMQQQHLQQMQQLQQHQIQQQMQHQQQLQHLQKEQMKQQEQQEQQKVREDIMIAGKPQQYNQIVQHARPQMIPTSVVGVHRVVDPSVTPSGQASPHITRAFQTAFPAASFQGQYPPNKSVHQPDTLQQQQPALTQRQYVGQDMHPMNPPATPYPRTTDANVPPHMRQAYDRQQQLSRMGGRDTAGGMHPSAAGAGGYQPGLSRPTASSYMTPEQLQIHRQQRNMLMRSSQMSSMTPHPNVNISQVGLGQQPSSMPYNLYSNQNTMQQPQQQQQQHSQQGYTPQLQHSMQPSVMGPQHTLQQQQQQQQQQQHHLQQTARMSTPQPPQTPDLLGRTQPPSAMEKRQYEIMRMYYEQQQKQQQQQVCTATHS